MSEFLLLMHGDAAEQTSRAWPTYLDGLIQRGRLRGGSSLGGGACFRKDGEAGPLTAQVVGFIRIAATDLEDARSCLPGNPVYEGGGTVEIRILVEDD